MSEISMIKERLFLLIYLVMLLNEEEYSGEEIIWQDRSDRK